MRLGLWKISGFPNNERVGRRRAEHSDVNCLLKSRCKPARIFYGRANVRVGVCATRVLGRRIATHSTARVTAYVWRRTFSVWYHIPIVLPSFFNIFPIVFFLFSLRLVFLPFFSFLIIFTRREEWRRDSCTHPTTLTVWRGERNIGLISPDKRIRDGSSSSSIYESRQSECV